MYNVYPCRYKSISFQLGILMKTLIKCSPKFQKRLGVQAVNTFQVCAGLIEFIYKRNLRDKMLDFALAIFGKCIVLYAWVHVSLCVWERVCKW